MKERELSLLDLIFDILLHWRSIIVAMLIGAVVLGGFSYAQSYRASQVRPADEDTEGVQEDIESKLTEEEIQNVKKTLLFEQKLEEELNYQKQSILLQLASNIVQKAEITFKVSADDSEQAYDIERVYEDAVISGELSEKLSDEYVFSVSAASELVNLERGSEEAVIGTDTFKISVIHYDAAVCKQMTESIVDFVDEKCKGFQKTLGAHDIEVVNQSVTMMRDTGIMDYQNQYNMYLRNLVNDIAVAKEAFSDVELEYYIFETSVSEEADNDNVEAIETEIAVTSGISLKYIILGMILGAFILVFWYFIAYIINGKVRTTDNLYDIYDIPQLGKIKTLSTEKKLFGFVDKWIISLRDFNKRSFIEEEALELASVSIKMAAGKKNLDTVYLVGCNLRNRTLSVCEQLKERLKKDSIHIEILNNVLYDAQAMCDLEKAQAVVLLETVGSTLYSEIARELELFNRQGVCVLGGILVE